MKIGSSLTLEVKHTKTNEIREYRCKIIEKNEHYLFIDHPIDKETQKTIFLPKGTHFSASYVGTDQAIYTFRTEVVAKAKLTVPALAIQFPEQNKIQRVQRRDYVRIETAVDVAIHSFKEDFHPFVTVTTDVSGGGISIVKPIDKQLTKNEKLNVWIVLPMHAGKHQYVYAHMKVIRVKKQDRSIATASLKFTSITNQDQQSIIRYCFKKQREARQKELF